MGPLIVPAAVVAGVTMLTSSAFWVYRKFFKFDYRIHLSILGARGVGKTTCWCNLNSNYEKKIKGTNEDGELLSSDVESATSIEVIQEFDLKIGKKTILIEGNTDTGGSENFVQSKIQNMIISKNNDFINISLILLNCNDYLHDKESRNYTNSIIEFVQNNYSQQDCKGIVYAVATHADECKDSDYRSLITDLLKEKNCCCISFIDTRNKEMTSEVIQTILNDLDAK